MAGLQGAAAQPRPRRPAAWRAAHAAPRPPPPPPCAALALAALQASKEGHEGATPEAGPWLLTLDFPSYFPVMTHAKNRCVWFGVGGRGRGVGCAWRPAVACV